MADFTPPSKEELVFIDDKLYAVMPLPTNPDFNVYQLIMTKEIFEECYNQWIPQPEPPEPDPPEPDPEPEDDPDIPEENDEENDNEPE
jgi:hypothetical protein